MSESAFQSDQEISEELTLMSWIDHVLFYFMLVVSAAISIYCGYFGNKQTISNYLYGGKNMEVFPIAMSLIASGMSGVLLLGNTAEMYQFGTQYIMCIFSLVLVSVLVVKIYLPVFYKLQVNSYEYFKLRFDNKIRLFASFTYVIGTFLYIPIVIYVPALTINQGMAIYSITPIVCIICIFYTMLGGLKGVVWADTLQFLIMMCTVFAIMIIGLIKSEGISEIWRIADNGKRLEFFNIDINPTTRTTLWSIIFGVTASWVFHFGITPAAVQRYLSLSTMKKAQRTAILFCIGAVLIKFVTCSCGLLAYAYFVECDPLKAGEIKKSDELFPYYVLKITEEYPGIKGLFVAGIFSAALSTMSTMLNTLSGMVYEDFIIQYLPSNISDRAGNLIMRSIVVISGFACVGLVFIVEELGGVFEMSISVVSVTSGPIVGLFTMGMLFPSANTTGAICGGIMSLITLMWFVFVKYWNIYFNLRKTETLPTNISGCSSILNTTLFQSNATVIVQEEKPLWAMEVSFYWYTFIGIFVVLIVGLPISYLSKSKSKHSVNKDLLSPVIYPLLSDVTTVNDDNYFSVALEEK